MNWRVSVDRAIVRRLRRIPEPDEGRLIQAILDLGNGPEGADIRPLEGREGYRLRVGGWRILLDMNIQEQTISLYSLGSRGDVYKH